MQYYFDGDSNLYAKAGQDFSVPARTKQMGSIENHVKIFVEDYVYTYLYQYGRSGGGKEKLAALIGKHYEIEGQDVLVISGAIQGKGTVQQNGVECFSDETWEYIGGQMQTYFKGMSVVGWVHCQPGFGAFLMARDEAFHKEYFKEKWQVLFVVDTMDKLDTFYIYNEEGKGLRQARGYFVYYDKNREMQEYMMENSMIRPREEAEEGGRQAEVFAAEQTEGRQRQRRKPTAEERMDAAKEIRKVLQKREKEVKQAKKEHDRVLAAVSGVLCVVCICMGLAMMQSLDRLRMVETELMAMQTSYQTLAEDFEGVKVQSVFAVQQAENVQQSATAEKVTNKKYTVESGDSLGYISRKFYGDNSGIARIMEANGLEDADMIYEGQALWIPE
ncbi:LysM peptidoglycan-binding domain-containing protein [Anaerotignum sp.]|nr:LysM peptidoglycan-binding domain-containing protein [Anaerotignum sp.]MBQ7758801.1 LysM peptidoglycan-binding domain-containing protein [Anaerotignum sp.]